MPRGVEVATARASGGVVTLSDFREMLADLTVPAVVAFLVACAVLGGFNGCGCSVRVTSKEAR